MLIELHSLKTPQSEETYNHTIQKLKESSEDIIVIDSEWEWPSGPVRPGDYWVALSKLWDLQRTIKEQIDNKKVVFVRNYTYALACFAIGNALFDLDQMRDPLSIAWCYNTFKGLVIPDLTCIITESLMYVETHYKKLVNSIQPEAENIFDGDCHLNFHRSKLFVEEDTILEYHKYAATAQTFSVSSPAISSAIILTYGTRWLDVKFKRIKFY